MNKHEDVLNKVYSRLYDAMNHPEKYWDIMRRRDEINKKKYYGGFKVGEENSLFKEELRSLETVYEDAIKYSKTQLEYMQPDLVESMKEFVSLHEGIEKIQRRLDELRYKRGDEDERGDE